MLLVKDLVENSNKKNIERLKHEGGRERKENVDEQMQNGNCLVVGKKRKERENKTSLNNRMHKNRCLQHTCIN